AANRNAIVEVDPATRQIIREFPVQMLPFEPRLTEDERTLIVSNWGGRPPASGTVSLIDRATGATRHVEVGIHPTAIVVHGGHAYVANAMSDSVSEIDIEAGVVSRTIPLRW